jgi:hypothetical protein
MYIRMLQTMWRNYGKIVSSGASCTYFGSFTKEGDFVPSSEFAEIFEIAQDRAPESEELP